jgi:hypothetical protein
MHINANPKKVFKMRMLQGNSYLVPRIRPLGIPHLIRCVVTFSYSVQKPMKLILMFAVNSYVAEDLMLAFSVLITPPDSGDGYKRTIIYSYCMKMY